MRTIYIAIFTMLLVITNPVFAAGLYPQEKENIHVFQEVAPLVVNVHNMQRVRRHFESTDVEAGSGSGFVYDKAGHIITNFHVIHDARGIVISLQNGDSCRAKVIGAEPRKDIAVLEIQDKKALAYLKKMKPLVIGSSSKLQVGQRTIAIGNPFGLDQTMTIGIVSALKRRIMGVTGISIQDMIQTDAAINPGNSGGPLLDSRGQLIGMNTLIYSSSGASAGIGFAVPVNDIKRVADQIIKRGRVIQPGFGVQLLGSDISRRLGIKGAIIGHVLPNTPAAKAGIKGTRRNARGHLHIGDVIVAVDKTPVHNYDDLYNLLDDKKIGQSITVTIIRNKEKKQMMLKTIDLSAMDG